MHILNIEKLKVDKKKGQLFDSQKIIKFLAALMFSSKLETQNVNSSLLITYTWTSL